MELADFAGLLGVPVLIALAEWAKGQGFPSARVPVLTLGLGLVLNMVLAIPLATDPYLAVLMGIVSGLAASGLYSGQKALRGQ